MTLSFHMRHEFAYARLTGRLFEVPLNPAALVRDTLIYLFHNLTDAVAVRFP